MTDIGHYWSNDRARCIHLRGLLNGDLSIRCYKTEDRTDSFVIQLTNANPSVSSAGHPTYSQAAEYIRLLAEKLWVKNIRCELRYVYAARNSHGRWITTLT